jgi:ATP-dependent protease ClpP protease subunit
VSRFASLQGGRAPVRIPLSPMRAEMALKALKEWREPAAGGREQRWYKISNASGDSGPTRVNIYDEISWWGISAQEFCDELAAIEGDVEVHINSPGGLAFDGMTIYNALASRSGGVKTVVDGLAASAASTIAMAGRPRVMSPGSMMMIHDASGLCIGNELDMLDTAKLLGKLSGNIASIYAAHSGTPADQWRETMRGEGWYTAQEAVDAGLADEVAKKADDADDATASWDTGIFARWQPPAPPAPDNEADLGWLDQLDLEAFKEATA